MKRNEMSSPSEGMIESYAAVDRIEGDLVILEIESYSITQNSDVPFSQRETFMAEISTITIISALGSIHEGDVLVVKHCTEEIHPVRFAPEEKERRVAFLVSLL